MALASSLAQKQSVLQRDTRGVASMTVNGDATLTPLRARRGSDAVRSPRTDTLPLLDIHCFTGP